MKKIIASFIVLILVACSNSESATNKFKTITYDELKTKSTDKKTVVVDARSNDYYNGWQDPTSKTNGHLDKAQDFSANWINVLNDSKDKKKEANTKRLTYDIENKGILGASNVIVYSSDIKEAQSVADFFVENKVDKAKVSLFLLDSSIDKTVLKTVKDYQALVSPKFVNDLVTSDKAENYNNKSYQVFEVSWGDATGSYDKAHIDKSVHINTDDFEHAPLWSLNTDKDLIKFAKKYGINKDATIVLYGEDQMASYRASIILKYMGAKDVRVLNGGLNAYTNAGFKTSTTAFKPDTTLYKGFDFSGKKLIDTYSDINKKMSKNWQLIDARTKEENQGSTSGYDDLKFKGTIKGSIFHGASFAQTPGDVKDYINIDNTMRNINDVNKMLQTAGIDTTKHMSFYCGSGWRVAQVLFYMQINGYTDTSMYSNGWYEYSALNK